MTTPPLQIGLLLFDDVEVLDFAGPFEVFSVTAELNENKYFRVLTISATTRTIIAKNGLSVNADFLLDNHPLIDILVVPGGFGTRKLLVNAPVIEWVRKTASTAQLVLSVCTGSIVLGKAGLLENLTVTTHHQTFELLKSVAPTVTIRDNVRFVDNGRIITAGGISAGIDMSLHVVARLCGEEVARKTATYMEYDWRMGPERSI
ncbi:MAG: DJ-1/PfpI family protein [candidate division Zixibacteria bacterium]|nr:DJ-1/PfpI family protein [candidate division Zixibacteria bacterium]